jgi:hypothetical protein
MKEYKLMSIDETIKGIMNSKPVKRTKKQQKEVDSLLRQLDKSKGFCAFQIPVSNKKEK